MTRLLITADTVGGIWHYATDLARALAAIGFEPIIAVLGPPPTAAQKATAAGLRLIETGLPLDWMADDPGSAQAAGAALATLAAELKVQLVQLNAPALATARFKVPVVAVAHSCVGTWWDAVKTGPLPDDLAWRSELTSAGLRRADAVVAPSAAFAAVTKALHALPRLPAVVHNGRALAAAGDGLPGGFAFTAGRLWDAAKNMATLDRAAAQLPVALLAAGPVRGPQGGSIDLAHVHRLGFLDDRALASHLAKRPVFVSAARYEPFGLAVLEAAAAGCALVLSDIPTFRELWGGVARFVDPDDADGFAEAITAQIADPGARLIAGAKAQKRARRFTTKAMADSMAAIYRALLPAAQVAA